MKQPTDEQIQALEERLRSDPKLLRKLIEEAFDDYTTCCYEFGSQKYATWDGFIESLEREE